MPNAAFRRSCDAWLAELRPEPPRFILPGSFLAAAMKSAKVLWGLASGTTSASGVKWNQNTGVTSAVLYCTSPSIGWNTICGRLTPTMFRPSPGSEFICDHISAPPAPALYWMMVSIAGHFFFSTTCWCRADKSDSPPGGNACQYMMFLSGQACAIAAGAAARHRMPIHLLMPTFMLSPWCWIAWLCWHSGQRGRTRHW